MKTNYVLLKSRYEFGGYIAVSGCILDFYFHYFTAIPKVLCLAQKIFLLIYLIIIRLS